jgi:hypothetical protein
VIGAGHRWGLAVFPLAAAVIAVWFALRLGRRFVGRRRPHEGAWTIALVMYALASLAMFYGVVDRWSMGEFRTFWLFGAVLNVPFLFAGELYLLAPRRVAHGVLALLAVAGVYAGLKVWGAEMNLTRLAGSSLPLGKDVFGDSSTPYRLAQFFSWPAYLLLLAGLVWSAYKMGGQPALRDRTAGTLGIALGATIVAIGSGVGAGFHIVPLFSVSLAAGIAVMYWGFARASRATAPRPLAQPAPGAPPRLSA